MHESALNEKNALLNEFREYVQKQKQRIEELEKIVVQKESGEGGK